MIVPQAELDLVHSGARQRMMLPVERGEFGELLPCRVEVGQCVRLQPRAFVRGMRITITTIEEIALGDLSDHQAKRLGYSTVKDALDAWKAQHGAVELTSRVLLAHFVRGDESAFYLQHRERYLKAAGVGLTYDPARSVHGEPSVTEEEQFILARKARNERVVTERERAKELRMLIKTALGELRGLELSKRVEDEIRRAEWRLEKLERVLEENIQTKAA